MLAAFVKEWHDYINSSCLSTYGCNDSLQILIMIIRRHVVNMPAQGIGQTVVAYIHHKIKILSADRLCNDSLGFTGAETRNLSTD